MKLLLVNQTHNQVTVWGNQQVIIYTVLCIIHNAILKYKRKQNIFTDLAHVNV